MSILVQTTLMVLLVLQQRQTFKRATPLQVFAAVLVLEIAVAFLWLSVAHTYQVVIGEFLFYIII